jgi:hypothetical protein
MERKLLNVDRKVTADLDSIISNIHQSTGLELTRPEAVRMLIRNFNDKKPEIKRKPKTKNGLMFI